MQKNKFLSVILITLFLFSIELSAYTSIQNQYVNAVKLMNMNQVDIAYNWFKEMINKTDSLKWKSAILYKLGECAYMLGKYDESADYLNRIVRSYSNSKYVFFAKKLLLKIDQEKAESKTQEETISVKETVKSDDENNAVKSNLNNTKSEVVINYNTNTVVKDNNVTKELTDNEISKLKKVEMLIDKGNQYFKNGKYELSEEAFLEALALEENDVIKFNLGLVNIKLNRFNKANRYFEDVYKNNPEDLEALQYVAFTYEKLERPLLSLIYWKRLNSLNPENKLAQNKISELQKIVDMN